MFSDRNGAKTIPFGVACAYSWISLYTPPQAKKPLVIARLLKPSPQKETTTTANLLLVTTTYCFVTWVYKAWVTYSYFETGCREKCTRQSWKALGWFWVLFFFQRNLKELVRKAMQMCLRVLKESNKSRFDSYSRQEPCTDHIPYYLSGLSRAHFFPTTFLEIAVCKFRA